MKRSLPIALVAISILTTVPAVASTFVHMSPKELVAQADALIQGRVVEMSSFWTESGRLIATDVMIQVDETLLGEASWRRKSGASSFPLSRPASPRSRPVSAAGRNDRKLKR